MIQVFCSLSSTNKGTKYMSNENKDQGADHKKASKCSFNIKFYFFIILPFMCFSIISIVASIFAMKDNISSYEFSRLKENVSTYIEVSHKKIADLEEQRLQDKKNINKLLVQVSRIKKKDTVTQEDLKNLYSIAIVLRNNGYIVKNSQCNEFFPDKILCKTDAYIEDLLIKPKIKVK